MINTNDMSFGIEVLRNQGQYTYGYAKIGQVVDNKFIDCETGKEYPIYDRENISNVQILILRKNIYDFLTETNQLAFSYLSVEKVKKSLKKIYVDVEFTKVTNNKKRQCKNIKK